MPATNNDDYKYIYKLVGEMFIKIIKNTKNI